MNLLPFLRRVGFVAGLLSMPLVTSVVTKADGVIATPDESGGPLWTAIKDDTYDQRAHFASGVDRLIAKLDDQVHLLKSRRAGMTTDTKDWDLAMKDVVECQSLLVSRKTELLKANTPETWDPAKENVGEAWKRAELAVDKMNTTITS